MGACRLIPKTDDSAFPYDEAMRLLILAQPAMTIKPKDFDELIEAGRKHGHWSPELIREHEEMAKRKRCFDFFLDRPPYLRGTLFENNIWFSLYSPEHEKACLRMIEALRQRLDVRIIHH